MENENVVIEKKKGLLGKIVAGVVAVVLGAVAIIFGKKLFSKNSNETNELNTEVENNEE